MTVQTEQPTDAYVDGVPAHFTAEQAEHRRKVLARIEEQQAEVAKKQENEKSKQQRRLLATSLFVMKVAEMGPGQPWESFQCDEIDAFAEFLRAHGYDAAAETVLNHHAVADTDEDDWHHDRHIPEQTGLESSQVA